MLKRLLFKNWRSLRDIEITDLTPLTVFIGANSSGKSNIVDALGFLRRVRRDTSQYSVNYKAQIERVRTIGVDESEPFTIEISLLPKSTMILDYALSIETEERQPHLIKRLTDRNGKFDLQLKDGSGFLSYAGAKEKIEKIEVYERDGEILPRASSGIGSVPLQMYPLEQTFRFIDQRWQLLSENFMPGQRLRTEEIGDVYLIDQNAHNTVLLLDFMQQAKLDLYEKLQEDLRWLLGHVERVSAERVYPEIRLSVHEKSLGEDEAPTISGGTSRLLAVLTAFYALEMRDPESPGLVVVEEPDMAVHPHLLRRFVELLRTYTEGEQPRQFILTTHNPHLLDWFEPEEVRIVERNERGETQVTEIPEEIREIWLDKYTLGEVWLTNSFGGLPE